MTDAARNQLQDRLVELRRLLKLFNDDAFALMKAVDYVESVVKEGQPHEFPAALNLIERLLDAEHPSTAMGGSRNPKAEEDGSGNDAIS